VSQFRCVRNNLHSCIVPRSSDQNVAMQDEHAGEVDEADR